MKKRSHSEMGTFRTCNRKWQHRYKNRYYPKDTPDALVLGSAFHAAIANYLLSHSIPEATLFALESIVRELGEEHEDVERLNGEVSPLIKYHLPKINADGRYRVVFDSELFEGAWNERDFRYAPMIEFKFSNPRFMGYADAVLHDTETDEYVIVDWKLRGSVSSYDKVSMDLQLPFYAGIINMLGGRIKRAIQWQFKKALPQDARVSKKEPKDGQPVEILSPSKATTWDHLVSTLPADWGGDIEELRGKFIEHRYIKGDLYFQYKTEVPITREILTNVYSNQYYTSLLIENAEKMVDEGVLMPGLMSSYECARCDYRAICSLQQAGKDISQELNKNFDIRV